LSPVNIAKRLTNKVLSSPHAALFIMGCAGSKAAEDDASLTGLGPGAEGKADSKLSSKADSKRSSKGGSTIKAKLASFSGIKLVCKTFVEGTGTECATSRST